MGNVQSPSSSYSSSSPTSQFAVPSRPFEKHGNMKSCFRHAIVTSLPITPTTVGNNNKNKLTNYSGSGGNGPTSSSTTTTTLMQLILLKDWQRVLIRSTLFPNEIDTVCVVKLYGISWKLLPIHLACASKPPTKVVAVLLSSTSNDNGNTNLASIPVKKRHSRKKRLSRKLKNISGRRHRLSSSSSSKSVVSARKELLSQKGNDYNDNSNSSFPDDDDDDSSFGSVTTTGTSNYKHEGYIHRNTGRGVGGRFIKGRLRGGGGGGGGTSLISLEESIGTNRSFTGRSFATSTHHQNNSTVGESTTHKDGASLCSFLDKTGIMLQLTETGGIAPIPVQQCNNKTSSKSTSLSSSSIPQNDTHSITADDDDDDDDYDNYGNNNPTAAATSNSKISLEIASDSILQAAAGAGGDDLSSSSPPLLLPIHIACLYQASPSAIQLLLQNYPMGSLSAVVGMLPIHIIAAQWKIESIESSHGIVIPSAAFDELLKLMNNNTNTNNGGGGGVGTNGINPNNLTNSDDWYTYQSLRVMQQQFPELLFAKSANHKMLPIEYVEEIMDNGPIKDECMEWLKETQQQQQSYHHQVHQNNNNVFRTTENQVNTTQDADGNLEMVPVEIHCLSSITAPTLMSTTTTTSSSSSSSSPFVPTESKLYNLFLERNWQDAIDMIESNPTLAKEWHYGIDSNSNNKTKATPRRSRFSNKTNIGKNNDDDEEEEDPILWKRLALHLACTVPGGPPIGLIDTLIEMYPEAVGYQDPHNGSIPLHLACQYAGSSSLPVVRSLIKAKSASTKAVDSRGRLPLHWAILSAAPYAVIEFLVHHDPSSILCPDQDGKTPLQYAHYSYPEGSPVVGLLEVVWM